jgi:thiamine transporter ThiT
LLFKRFLIQITLKVGQEMGAILDLVEKMRTPTGIVVTIAIIAIAVFFIRWVFADDQEKKD